MRSLNCPSRDGARHVFDLRADRSLLELSAGVAVDHGIDGAQLLSKCRLWSDLHFSPLGVERFGRSCRPSAYFVFVRHSDLSTWVCVLGVNTRVPPTWVPLTNGKS